MVNNSKTTFPWFQHLLAGRFQHLGKIERKRIANPSMRLRLHRLERPVPWGKHLIDLAHSTFKPEHFNQYPDYSPFYEKLADFYQVPADHLVVGLGAEDLIRSIYLVGCDPPDGEVFPGDMVTVTWPSCAMYEIYAKAFNLRFRPILTEPERPLEADLPPWWRCRVLFIVNPGQPVETCLPVDTIRQLADWAHEKRVLLVIDEAYFGFGAPTALRLIDDFDNLIILRTFSKAYGLAGLRIGVALGQPRLIKTLSAIRLSGELPSFSMHVVSTFIDHFTSEVAPGIRQVVAGRLWLRSKITERLGLKTYGRYANHVLVDLGSSVRCKNLISKLIDRGVYIRQAWSTPPLDRHAMITCGPQQIMEDFFDEFSQAYHAI